nr:hypothetical protein [uncultured Caproiciproducens sp.]
MIRKSKREIKEILIKQADQNTPDVWSKIESQLRIRPEPQVDIRRVNPSHKIISRYAIAGFAILLVASVSVYAFQIRHNTIPFDPSPVSLDSLRFSSSPNLMNLPKGNAVSMDIAAFSEKYVISHSDLICKATVINSYIKDYKQGANDGKSKSKILIYPYLNGIVYEIRIDALYYTKKEFKAGDVIKVENGLSAEDPSCILQQNRQYILNLYEYDIKSESSSSETGNYAFAPIKRDGKYGICYSFAPQIEVTLDQQYVFHSDWISLLNDKTIDVMWDKGQSSRSEFYYYEDKMKLRQDKYFIDDYKKMIAKYKS